MPQALPCILRQSAADKVVVSGAKKKGGDEGQASRYAEDPESGEDKRGQKIEGGIGGEEDKTDQVGFFLQRPVDDKGGQEGEESDKQNPDNNPQDGIVYPGELDRLIFHPRRPDL